MNQSFLHCVYWTQQHYLQDEILLLQRGQKLPKRGPLSSLHPFLDATGLLKVGGRLENTSLPYDQKHPVVLPGCSVLANLIIHWAHKASLHG